MPRTHRENLEAYARLAVLEGDLSGYDDMSDSERLAAGANDSIVHVDWMIGSGEMDVDGVLRDGSTVPLMRAGEWVV